MFITEAGALNRLFLREQTRLLEARKAEDEFLASKISCHKVIIIDGNGECFWSTLPVFLDSAGLPPENPESIIQGTASVLRAVHPQDCRCKIRGGRGGWQVGRVGGSTGFLVLSESLGVATPVLISLVYLEQ